MVTVSLALLAMFGCDGQTYTDEEVGDKHSGTPTAETSDTQDSVVIEEEYPDSCHPFDPVDVPFMRRYAVAFYEPEFTGLFGNTTPAQISETVEVQRSEGLVDLEHPNIPFDAAYKVRAETQGQGFTEFYYLCDVAEEGAFEIGFHSVVSNKTVDKIPDTPRRFLPPAAEFGSSELWEYDQFYNIQGFLQSRVNDSGTYTMFPEKVNMAAELDLLQQELDYQGISVLGNLSSAAAADFEAYLIEHQYTLEETQAASVPPLLRPFVNMIFGTFFGGGGSTEYHSSYWYVEGIGVVAERTVDPEATGIAHYTRIKVLTEYEGLTAP